MFTLGIVRGELAVLLWGGFFAFLSLYSLAGICYLWWRSTAVFLYPGWRVDTTPLAPEANESFLLRVAGPEPLPILPLFRWKFQVYGEHSKERRWKQSWDLPISTETLFPTTANRGFYDLRVWIQASDVFGFTTFRRKLNVSYELQVLPAITDPGSPDFRPPNEGSQADRSRKKRTDELLEVRKYYPGDDVRRIHWRLYAHAGEPFLRIGEEIPPPSGQLTIVLDTSAYSERHLDERLAFLSGYLETLGQKHCAWTVVFPQQPRFEGNSQSIQSQPLETKGSYRNRLSELRAEPPQIDRLPHRLPNRVVLFGHAGCSGMETLAKALQEKGCSVRPFFLPAQQRGAKPTMSWWWRPQ